MGLLRRVFLMRVASSIPCRGSIRKKWRIFLETRCLVCLYGRAKYHRHCPPRFLCGPIRSSTSITRCRSITSHILDKGAQNVRYYRVYSNNSRGFRKKEQEAGNKILIADSIPLRKTCTKSWASLIKKIYEVDPLTCPRCSHSMRMISIIDSPEIAEKIFSNLDLWYPQAHSPPVNKETKIVEDAIYDYGFFDYLPA